MTRNMWIVQAHSLLRKLEWAVKRRGHPRYFMCPSCGNFRSTGHMRDCRLAALLKEVPE